MEQYLHNVDINDIPEVKEYMDKLVEKAAPTYLPNMFPAGVVAGFLFVICCFWGFVFNFQSSPTFKQRNEVRTSFIQNGSDLLSDDFDFSVYGKGLRTKTKG